MLLLNYWKLFLLGKEFLSSDFRKKNQDFRGEKTYNKQWSVNQLFIRIRFLLRECTRLLIHRILGKCHKNWRKIKSARETMDMKALSKQQRAL